MKTLLREIYPEAKTLEAAVTLLCADIGYNRASVWQWMSGDAEPRPVVMKWIRQRQALERICEAAVTLEVYVEGKENDALPPNKPKIERREVRNLVAEARASCSL